MGGAGSPPSTVGIPGTKDFLLLCWGLRSEFALARDVYAKGLLKGSGLQEPCLGRVPSHGRQLR